MPATLPAAAARPDYGIDAPGVVRNLALVGAALLVLSLATFTGWLPRTIVLHPSEGAVIRFPIRFNTLIAAAAFLGTAAWMFLGSRYGKLAERERLLDHVDWSGHEQVLDVGCGRGLLLVAAARRLTDGLATGVDIWQAEDLSGNRPDVPLANARLEGVGDRVAVRTADMRSLPFPAASFDVVVSRAAIHNLYAAADRAAAIREIARVLKPGGRAVVADIRHHHEYARTFAENGCGEVQLLDSRIAAALYAALTFGSLRPNTMLVRKHSS